MLSFELFYRKLKAPTGLLISDSGKTCLKCHCLSVSVSVSLCHWHYVSLIYLFVCLEFYHSFFVSTMFLFHSSSRSRFDLNEFFRMIFRVWISHLLRVRRPATNQTSTEPASEAARNWFKPNWKEQKLLRSKFVYLTQYHSNIEIDAWIKLRLIMN